MGLQLVIGGSGTGKTEKLYGSLIKKSAEGYGRGEHFLAIVPEQFTMETQKTIVELSETRGTMAIDILSFERLAKRIFEEAGLSTLKVLDDTGKCLILRKIIEENKDKFTVFGSKAKMAGFIEEMKSMVCELYQYGISEDKFDEMLVQAEKRPLLYAKLEDIKLIVSKLKEYLSDKFIMNEELLQRVCELIPNSGIVKGSTITLDEYTGFSPVQYDVIRMLLKYAAQVNIAITVREADKVDYSGANEADVFSLSVKTINKLKQIAMNENVEIYSDIILTEMHRAKAGSAIAFLEKNLFKYGIKPYHLIQEKKQGTEGKPDGDNNQGSKRCQEEISIHVCANPVAEAEYAAYTIHELVRKEGYRYKDIAVVTADIESYYYAVTEAFRRHDIPCFIDYKRSIIANPLVESIRAVLEIITDNYSYESVFRYLRCGLSSLSRNEIDLLENYVISHGIRGVRKWSRVIENEREEYEIARQKVLEDTLELYQSFKSNRELTVKEAITALYNFVLRLRMEQKLSDITGKFYEMGDISRGNEFSQTYELVVELFDKTVFLIGNEKINARELAAMLDSGFEDIKVGIVPPTLDRVVVGDIERTRLNHVKILFLIGANDGLIPKSGSTPGVLTQAERSFLSDNGITLSPTARENAFIQKYYLYRILTKMSERLYISFKRSGNDGSSQRQSYIVTTLMNLFRGMKVVDEEKENINTLPKNVTNIQSAVSHVAGNIHAYISGRLNDSEKNVFRELYVLCLRNGIDMSGLIKAAAYSMENTAIDKSVARAIYGDNMHNSVSRLETFASCAYKHFISYGLMLVERKEYEVQRSDIGSIYHNALELFFKKVKDRKLTFDRIDRELRDLIISESVEEAAEQEKNAVFEDSSRNAYMIEQIKKVSKKTAWILQQQIMAGEFVPSEFELHFSSDYGLDKLKYIYDDGTQMGLRGIIDRVDYYNDGDDIYVKIVDYKSGNKKLEINDIYNGLQLQLVVYMEAALEMTRKKYPNKHVIPGGMFYYNIDNPVVNADEISGGITDDMEAVKENIDNIVLGKQRLNGFVCSNEKIINVFDKNMPEIKEKGGDSLYIPVGYTKKGTFKSGSGQIAGSDMNTLIDFVHLRTGELGRRILEGDIGVNPYIKSYDGGETPCNYCEYRTICGFDKNVKGAAARTIHKEKSEEIWCRIRKEGGETSEEQ